MKQHKSYPEQIVLLKSRGLIIRDDAVATDILSNVNYYRLSGYLFGFRKPQSEDYVEGISIENILRLYRFDSKLTRILMYALEDVEESLKTHFSSVVSLLLKAGTQDLENQARQSPLLIGSFLASARLTVVNST